MFPRVIVKQISWQQHLKCAKRPLVLHHLLQGLPRTTQELSSDGECPLVGLQFSFWRVLARFPSRFYTVNFKVFR